MKKILYLIWYNDWFRLFLMSGIHLIPTALFFLYIEFKGENVRIICLLQYLSIIILLFIFNDYTNLEKIGYDVYGNKIKNKK